MRLAWWMLVHEARIQVRSYRFRVLAVLYLALAIAAPVALHLTELTFVRRFGPGLWGACVESCLPIFSMLLAWVLAGDGILRERDENSFLVVSLGVGTNAAYLASRWFAVTAIVLAVSIVPLLVTTAIGVRGVGGASVALFAFVQWLAVVVPLVMMSSALSMGISTIARSTVGGTIATLLGGTFVFAMFQNLLARFGRTIAGPLEWLRLERPFDVLSVLLNRWSPRKPLYTDASFDWRIYLELAIPRALVMLALSLFAIVAAAAFLRRSSPNHRVWRIRENHPIRTYLGALRSLAENLKPDAGLRLSERVAVVAAAVLVLLSVVAIRHMDERWRQAAEERATTERETWPDPGRADLAVETIAIKGEIDPAAGLDTEVVLSMINRGSEPVGRFAAELNPALDIEPVSPSGLMIEKRWNRVDVRFPRPIEGGGRVELTLRLSGVPSEFLFAGYRKGDFPDWFDRVKAARVELYIPDFSRSKRVRSISSRRVDLEGSALFPVPRGMPWGDPDQSVQQAEIMVDLSTAKGRVLATSCGDLSVASEGSVRLQSRCRGEIRAFSIVGADWIETDLGDDAVLVCLDSHRSYGERKARELVDAFAEAHDRWPDLGTQAGPIIAEVPNEQRFEAAVWQAGRGSDLGDEPTIKGAMVRVTEDWLMSRKDVSPGQLMVALRAQALLARRAIDPGQAYFFRYFYGTLAAAELGYTRDNGAVLGQSERVRVGLLQNESWDPIWEVRLPAIVEALRYRVGTNVLMGGVQELLETDRTAPATARELFEILERRSGKPLDRFYAEFVEGNKIPNLQLADVTFVRQGSAWIVDGDVTNDGEGHAVCEVVLRTDVSTLTVEVEVDGEGRGSFHFEAPQRPVKVELDPDRKCFRWEPKTTLREVVNKGGRG